MTENYRLPENAEASIVGCVLLCPDTKPAVAKLVSEGDFPLLPMEPCFWQQWSWTNRTARRSMTR